MLDGALARVQAAWLVAHLSSLGPTGEDSEVLLEDGVVPGLVRLLAEAVDAVTLATAATGEHGRHLDAWGRRGTAAAAEWVDGALLEEVDSEW